MRVLQMLYLKNKLILNLLLLSKNQKPQKGVLNPFAYGYLILET